MIKQGLDYDGNVSLVWLLYKDECSEGHVVFSGSRGDQWAVWIRNQFLCLLTRSGAGSPLCTGQCNFNNLLLSPGRLELPTPSLVSGLSVSLPFFSIHILDHLFPHYSLASRQAVLLPFGTVAGRI